MDLGQSDRIAELEAALRQAVHALDREIAVGGPVPIDPDELRLVLNDNEHPKVPAVPRYHHAAPAPERSPESNRGDYEAYEVERLRERLDALHEELTAFAEYSRSVAADAAGPARRTWQEHAEWADRLAVHANV